MELRQLILDNPESFLLLFSTWALAALWIVIAITTMIEAKLNVGQGGMVIFLALAFASAATMLPKYDLTVFLLMILVSFIGPRASQSWNRREHMVIDAEVAQKNVQMLVFDPNNIGARMKLAETCYEAGLLPSAVEHLRLALSVSTRQFSPEKTLLKKWEQELVATETPSEIICPSCRIPNHPIALNCRHCGAPILYLLVAGFWLPPGMMLRVLKAWSVVPIVALASAFVALGMAPAIALPLEIVILTLGLLAFWKSLK